ncbi:hypothetical protein GCM10011498_01970 [Amylibacter cionae]|uniref:Uncharacterized protein n=1 Tax=Neptunicoccus cionae TaxID=2035344 RepID=A0A916QSH4_9RHOB|nr:hypothetical protein GCM10011498_01970 [Amylibacter cionae]
MGVGYSLHWREREQCGKGDTFHNKILGGGRDAGKRRVHGVSATPLVAMRFLLFQCSSKGCLLVPARPITLQL